MSSVTTQLAGANLRQHRRRYTSTTVAIALSMAFIFVALMFGRALNNSIDGLINSMHQGAAAVITANDTDPEDIIRVPGTPDFFDKVRQIEGVTEIYPAAQEFLEFQHDAEKVSSPVENLAPEHFSRPELVEGKFPATANELALHSSYIDTLNARVGDTVNVKVAFSQAEYKPFTITGIVKGRASGQVSSIMTSEGLSAFSPELNVNHVLVMTPESAQGQISLEQQEQMRNRVAQAIADTNLLVSTHDAEVANVRQELQSQVVGAQAMMLMFPVIAVTVALIVVSTTFRVVLYQRQREIALLRTLGGTAKQVRRLLLVETLGIGVVASLVGVVFGALAGVVLLRASGMASSLAEAAGAIGLVEMLSVVVAGIVLTVLVGLRPAFGAAKTAPLMALQAAGENSTPLRLGWARLILATGGLVLASAACWWAMTQPAGTERFQIILGASVCGLLCVLGVIGAFFPGLSRALGIPVRGILPTIARENLMRNPGRTRSTGTAIIIGVTLVATMMIGAASTRATLNGKVDEKFPVDLIAQMLEDPLESSVISKIAAVDGVKAFASVHGVMGAVLDQDSPEPTTLPAEEFVRIEGQPDLTSVARRPVDMLSDQQILLAASAEQADGESVLLCVTQAAVAQVAAGEGATDTSSVKCRTLTVVKAENDTAPTVSQKTLLALAPNAPVNSLVLTLDDDANATQVQSDLLKVEPHLIVVGAALERQHIMTVVNTLLLVVIAMLGVSVLVSVVGVANTMSLSVHERSSENGLLRALGLSRAQMRRLLLWEAVLISFTATFIGIGLGFVFAWLGMQALPLDATVIMVVPWWQLAVVVVVSFASTLLAAWLPGRRAARTSPIEALQAI